MPNYKYVCDWCEFTETVVLPISSDPSALRKCKDCTRGNMSRRINVPGSIAIERETLGKWYKNNTGKELLGES